LVIFDLDNTLIDRTVPLRRWAAHFVTRHGLDPSELTWLINADGDGYVPRERFLTAVRDRYGLDEPVDTLLNSFRDEIVALVDIDPRVPAALARLRHGGWRIAIATNGTVAQQLAKIRRTGLDAHVDAIAVSEEVGFAKPDRRMFHAAAQRCGHRLDDGGWMVGDCPVRDIAGGRQVGLRTIWLHRGRAWDPASPVPEAIVDEVSDTPPVLGSPSRT
jgi:HAD superfamily hydrolase (TIGR01549 family)